VFKSKYIDKLFNENVTNKEALVYALEVIDELKWNIKYYNEFEIVAFTGFSMSSWGERIQITIKDGNLFFRSECAGIQLFDWGKNKRNILSFIYLFESKKKSKNSLEVDTDYTDIEKNFDNVSKDQSHNKPYRFSSILSYFKLTDGYYITPLLININIVFFLLMLITGANIMSPDGKYLLFWGANFRPYTIGGEWWRLITSCFVHVGILHLVFNMAFLTYIGKELEPLLGRKKILTAFVLSGMLGSLTSIYWNEFIVSAGASGAIFGLFGVFLITLLSNKTNKHIRESLFPSLLAYIIISLILGNKPGVDNAAHIGGLVGGIVIGTAFLPILNYNLSKKITYITIGTLSISVISLIIYMSSTLIINDYAKYLLEMTKLIKMESKISAVVDSPYSYTYDNYMYEFENTLISGCESNIKLITSFEELELSDSINTLNKERLKYYQLRLKRFELYYRGIINNTNINDKVVDSLGEVITEMKPALYISRK